MADAVPPNTTNPQQPSVFTLFDLIHLLIRDSCLAGCVVGGWLLDKWGGVIVAVPVGWLVGWGVRYVVMFFLALALKHMFVGPFWSKRQNAESSGLSDQKDM